MQPKARCQQRTRPAGRAVASVVVEEEVVVVLVLVLARGVLFWVDRLSKVWVANIVRRSEPNHCVYTAHNIA